MNKLTIAELASRDDWVKQFIDKYGDTWNSDRVFFAQQPNGCVYVYGEPPKKDKDGYWCRSSNTDCEHLECYTKDNIASDHAETVISIPFNQSPKLTLLELAKTKKLTEDENSRRYFAQDADGSVYSFARVPRRDDDGDFVFQDDDKVRICESHGTHRMCSNPECIYDAEKDCYVAEESESQLSTLEIAKKYGLQKHLRSGFKYLIQAADGYWWACQVKPTPNPEGDGHWSVPNSIKTDQTEELGSDQKIRILTLEDFGQAESSDYAGENDWL